VSNPGIVAGSGFLIEEQVLSRSTGKGLPSGNRNGVSMKGPSVVQITVQGEGVAVECAPGETILEAMHRTGHALRVGCRRGGCAVCKLDVIAGEYEYTRPLAEKVLTDEERGAGVCLTCRAVPLTDMTVKLREEEDKRVSSLLAFYAAALDKKKAAGT
jgi:ferredoxin